MAKTKAKGTSKLGRDSISKRLGVKIFHGEKVGSGAVIVRQRGTRFFPGQNVKKGADDTLYSLKAGQVKFLKRKLPSFSGRMKIRKIISVT